MKCMKYYHKHKYIYTNIYKYNITNINDKYKQTDV